MTGRGCRTTEYYSYFFRQTVRPPTWKGKCCATTTYMNESEGSRNKYSNTFKENIDLKLYHVHSHFQCIFTTITCPDEMKYVYQNQYCYFAKYYIVNFCDVIWLPYVTTSWIKFRCDATRD